MPQPSRSRTHLRAGALVVLTALALGAAPAGATAGERGVDTYRAAKRAPLTLVGHGFGHGHGMSQYGAQGAAAQGLAYDQILAFYYPGLTPGTSRGAISVLVSGDTTDDVEVLNRSGLTVRDVATGKRTALAPGPSRYRLVAQGARTKVQALTSRWRTVLRTTGEAELKARGPLTLVTPNGRLTYRGWLRSASPTTGGSTRDTVNILPLEQYLRGVVPREIPASWSPAAVQAQAVAARTYADHGRSAPLARHYQVCDTTACQVYAGSGAEHPLATAAIKATRGVVLTEPAGAAFTQFSASSGGWTAAGSKPYLTAQPDPYDGWAGNPVHDWTATLTPGAIEAAFPSVGTLTRVEVTGRDGNGDWGGRVVTVLVAGSAGQVKVSGDTWRSRFGLRSTWFAFG